ncbi:hypothetical protein DBR39_23355 [Chryseobacterium sp. KBW03]|uniref:hypothetical protein n=1 Tax=Chryseobacterium sp. KBW03 TaxID=2153362 RepID=UPI000F59F2A7|nr:hypothetical protein [Chryseobacterium sp. KBW03]RQO33135.1 hypothetical protein DBR39_23355 [Chryseobacterium sp. KBW03]
MAKSKIDSIQIQKIVDSIDLKYKLEYINNKVDNNLNIINGVNEFYDSAWLKLICLLTFVGIVMPLVVQYIQKKNFEELITSHTDNINKIIAELKSDNESRINAELNILESKFQTLEIKNKKTEKSVDASMYFLQGRSLLMEKRYWQSIASIAKSLEFYTQDKNVSRVSPLILAIKTAIQKIENKDEIQKINDNLTASGYSTLEILINRCYEFSVENDSIGADINFIRQKLTEI